MTARIAKVERETKETKIRVEVNLDGTGVASIQTPLPFLSHMLDQIARHGSIDLTVHAEGDVEIDGHHTTEDIGIVLGKAVLDALGERKGIRRYGSATLPMDEALVTAALDLSGRPFFVWRVPLPKAKIGTWDVELAESQVRTWSGWHHHQALSLIAAWFLVQEARRGKKARVAEPG